MIGCFLLPKLDFSCSAIHAQAGSSFAPAIRHDPCAWGLYPGADSFCHLLARKMPSMAVVIT